MKASLMMPSRFLKKDDVENPKLVTIEAMRQENVAPEDQPAELKWTMHFAELDRPMVLNSTNIQLCTQVLGTDETNDWIGKQIVLYNDPNVSFGGKLTGGVRIRARKLPPAAVRPTPEQIRAENASAAPLGDNFEDSDIPF